jgi:uncharacterized membrane protein YebE (DUF533 family)
MSFGDILGQIMQKGLGERAEGNPRLRTTADNLSRQGGTGLDSLLDRLQGALGGAGIDTGSLRGTAGGFGDRAGEFLRKEQAGGLSGAQIGGIGALAGAVLGRGLGGAARGGAMAILGTLALTALKNAQARKSGAAELPPLEPDEIAAVTAPENERLLLTAMIAAAKADGQIDQNEMQKLVSRISEGSVTDEERQFVLSQMAAPIDVHAIAAQVRSPAQAAQVYAASLMAIANDTEQERQHMRDLARALGLDDATVAELHGMTGVAKG